MARSENVMSKFGSYAGQILRINLRTKSIRKERLDKKIARTYLGSKGVSAYILFNELEARTDPLGAENRLIFMTGPLTGTTAPMSNRFSVSAKSPLTDSWCDSHCGGSWGPELKFAGYDGIIVDDKSPEPVYLNIEDEEVKILDAGFVWGSDTFSTERVLKDKHSSDRMPRVASIGPAGERQALLASVISEVRAAGRGGMGAVMGSKNLKAIVVTGNKYKPKDFVANPEALSKAVKSCYTLLSQNENTAASKGGRLTLYGTANIVRDINAAGGWPTRNFQTGIFEHASELKGEALAEKLWIPHNAPGTRPCYNCPVLCAHVAIVREGKYVGTFDEGPEYETVWALGPQCGVSDREAIARADYLCDYYGLDTISVGNTIGFLMECYERGLITKDDTSGIDLRFGNADAMVVAVDLAGQGLGKLGQLASNGVKKAAERIGQGSEKFAIHSKGMELPAYEPRAAQGMGLNYAVGDRGACHLHAWTGGDEMLQPPKVDPRATEGKAKAVKNLVDDTNAVWDSAGVCRFLGWALSVDDMFGMVNAATGFRYKDSSELTRIGERISNLTRAFNIREGLSKKDDTLPHRLLVELLPEGPCKGQVVRLEEMLTEYYKLSGWDAEGKPTREKLTELGLDFVARELYDKS
jgi:aldehyde:ferredoxin oxidoreductase